MGYQVGAQCFGDAATAAAVSASSQAGLVVQVGAQVYGVEVAGVTASAISYDLHPVGGGSAVGLVVPFAAQPCGLLEWSDGLALGWAVAGVWLATFAVLMLKKAANA
jgi:hypothetical protein